jgi:hypothetical protein
MWKIQFTLGGTDLIGIFYLDIRHFGKTRDITEKSPSLKIKGGILEGFFMFFFLIST